MTILDLYHRLCGKRKMRFDCVFSLGGSCASAIQLRYKGIRRFAYPFDWLFSRQIDSVFSALNIIISKDTSQWILQNDMVELLGSERGDSKLYQYKNIKTGYCFIHDFIKPITDYECYHNVESKYQRRFKRLFEHLNRSSKVLMVLDTSNEIDLKKVTPLLQEIESIYHLKVLFLIFKFNSQMDRQYDDRYFHVEYIQRRINKMDYTSQPKEWDFLRNIELSDKGKEGYEKALENG